MADFSTAFWNSMGWEDSKTHPGKVTTDNNGALVRFGINAKANPDLVAAGFYTMNYDDALELAQGVYQARYWAPVRGDLLNDQKVANKVFDLAVNAGSHQAGLELQRAVNQLFGPKVIVDGFIGQRTVDAANALETPDLLGALIDGWMSFIEEEIQNKPQDAQYRNGWEVRANA